MSRSHRFPLAVVAALALLLYGCTGSQEARTPVALVTAGEDTTGNTLLGLVATGLPPSSDTDEVPLRWLDGFERTVAGSFVDLAVARDAPVRVYLLVRQGDSDLLTRFDASALILSDPSSLTKLEATPIDLSVIVADSGVLSSDEALCTRGMSVSPSGSWIGLLHDPAGCSGTSTASTPTVLLVEIEPEAGSSRRVGPASLSRDDAAATPVFTGTGDDASLVWSLRDGLVKTIDVSDPAGPPQDLVELELSGDPVLELGALGLVAADSDALTSISLDGTSVADYWPVPAGAGALDRVVDASLLTSPSAIALSDSGVVFVPDVSTAPELDAVAFTAVTQVRDAVVDPYAYLYVASPAGLVAYDLLRAVSTGTLTSVSGASTALAAFEPLAVDWLFDTSIDVP